MSASDLASQIKSFVENLATAVDDAAKSDAIKNFLETASRFHNYSFNNQLLIWFSNPEATHVAGYNTWINKFGRYVKKGEHGIAILAPVFAKKIDADGEETHVLYFKTVYVFDVSQTDGKPLPEAPEWKSLERSAELENRLVAFAASKCISVERVALGGETQGVSMNGKIKVDLDAGTKTLIHELAHEILDHHESAIDRHVKEIEAEATAWVVMKHFGFSNLNCPNYLSLWQADSKEITARLTGISQAARQIIEAVEEKVDVNEVAYV